MILLNKNTAVAFFIVFLTMGIGFAQDKQIYVPSTFGNENPDNPNSQWSYNRSRESENFIVFWESGYGQNPLSHSDAGYRVDVDAILDIAEESFTIYRDSLDFIEKGNSRTDEYKMIILIYYTRDWIASGSGVDDVIGLLNLSAWSAQVLGVTVAHEVAHCFQYQVACDGYSGGWRYGLGENGAGGNGWWEQCAQWQAFQVFPERKFSEGNMGVYLESRHKHILHEYPRYANHFIQDYMALKHGQEIIGKLWRESEFPEDPVEAYIRLTNIDQAEFNDQIYEQASRLVTWDIPAIEQQGRAYRDDQTSPEMDSLESGFWRIPRDMCLENYGYNVIRLNAPKTARTVTVQFNGKAGLEGYRELNKSEAGWRFGFVALLENDERVYSDIGRANFLKDFNVNPSETLQFECPDNVSKLWLVVTGAPQSHWKHEWDDDDSNDEQWPYEVSFLNTNIYGYFNITDPDESEKEEEEEILSFRDTNSSLIYPNPTADNINIEFIKLGFTPSRVQLLDLGGKILLDQRIKNLSAYQLNISDYPEGTYIIRLSDGQSVTERKVLKK